MVQEHIPIEEIETKMRKPKANDQADCHSPRVGSEALGLTALQHQIGNRAVRRLLIQRSGDGASFELDEQTASRINRERAGGQPLDSGVQRHAGAAMGHDLSGVRVHTSPEADDLSHQLSAKAFTTGQDIFFREGAYSPGSSSGQHLISHELTHVVQQATGAVSGSGAVLPSNDEDEANPGTTPH